MKETCTRRSTLKTTAIAGFNIPADHCFIGYDAYHKVAASDTEFVLLVTPPLFRPLHLEAMLKAGKNVFIEKPVAVDAPGCRKVLELGEYAKTKGLGIRRR